LKDPNFVTELLKNPDLVNMAVKSHMQQVKDTPSPMTITGSQGGGQAPAAPPNRPKSMDEAHEMAAALFANKHA
jgi:hypothetical protein